MRITTLIAALSLVAFIGCSKDKKSDDAEKAPVDQPAKADTPKAEVAEAAQPAAEAPAAETIGEVTAEDLAGWIEAGSVAVLDSNNEKTRTEFGKIPTATLLTSSSDYELDELPSAKDKKLVFYCSNTQCGASKKSAKKALAAGYSDVNILPVGVIGWKEAGNDTEKAL